MTKKKQKSPSGSSSSPKSPKAPKSPKQRKSGQGGPSSGVTRQQTEMLDMLQQEIAEFYEIALMVMSDEGILPPLYGGDYLGNEEVTGDPIDRREIIPLWGVSDDDPELVAVLLRVMGGTEPNLEMRQMRGELEMVNDWPLAELLDMMVTPEGDTMIKGSQELRNLSMMVALFGTQVKPAPGYDQKTMIDYMSSGEPHALFIHIPTTVEGDTLTYRWDDLEHFYAEVVYAPSQQMLQAAVWEYCLNLGLDAERKMIEEEGDDEEDELILENAAEWSCLFELFVVQGMRVYGSTSPVRATQAKLDIIREENNDLVVTLPLKPEVEPLAELADFRREALQEPIGKEVIRLPGDSNVVQQIWPTIRANDFYGLRMRNTTVVQGPRGEFRLGSNIDQTYMDWFMGDTLPEVYLQVRLAGIYEMLALCHLIKANLRTTTISD